MDSSEMPIKDMSLSARRAWIEINRGFFAHVVAEVALRKESVDRNLHLHRRPVQLLLSLSARRAWIEMHFTSTQNGRNGSLSARRAWIEISSRRLIRHLLECRSPQGERG